MLAALVASGAAAASPPPRANSPDASLDRFVAVEPGGSAVTVLDGRSLSPIHRFHGRPATLAAPAFTRDGRYAFIATADGWIAKLDLIGLRLAAEVRAAPAARAIALSGDDRYLAVASATAPALVLLDAGDMTPIKTAPVDHRGGLRTVLDAPPRQSFVAVPEGIAELWEISYSDNPPHRGWVHDYRDDGVPAQRPRFPVRRMELRSELDSIAFGGSHEYVVAASRRTSSLHIVDLYIGRRFAEIPLPGQPQLESGAHWARDGVPIMAIPDGAAGPLRLIDMSAWREVEQTAMPSGIELVRTEASLQHAWAAAHDTIHVIDKATLATKRTLRPAPGRPVAGIAFDRQGRRAVVSLGGADGLLVVYDAESLAELTRTVMPAPIAVYGASGRGAQ